jgi:hypothetical protein
MKKRFLQFGLFLIIGCLWVSLGVNKVQAAPFLIATSSQFMYSGDSVAFTVPATSTCPNALLYFGGESVYWRSLGNLEYDGVPFTYKSAGSTNGDGSYARGYLFNPNPGTHNLYAQLTGTTVFALFCGIDSVDGSLGDYNYNQYGTSCAGSENISIDEDDSIIIGNSGTYGGSLISSNFGTIISNQYIDGNGAVAIGYKVVDQGTNSWGLCSNNVENDGGFSIFHSVPIVPTSTLTIAINDFNSETQLLHLYGLCSQQGTGINQMRIIGLADNATTSQPVLPDPLGVDRGSLVDCNGTYNAYYNGFGLVGTHFVAVDDTFYGSEWVTWEQDFNATSTPDWEFSYGYMSEDDPTGTASKLACSDEEWATPDPVIGIDWLSATTSVAAFNFTKIKCQIIKQYYISMFSLRDQIKSAGHNSATVLGNMFPFNFSTAIKNAWTQSASSTLPTGLEFLNSSNASGTISIPVTIGNASGSVPIWGTAIFNKNASSTAAYNSIRTVSTWLIRLAFFALVFLLGSKIYHEFNQSKQ